MCIFSSLRQGISFCYFQKPLVSNLSSGVPCTRIPIESELPCEAGHGLSHGADERRDPVMAVLRHFVPFLSGMRIIERCKLHVRLGDQDRGLGGPDRTGRPAGSSDVGSLQLQRRRVQAGRGLGQGCAFLALRSTPCLGAPA
jgi:hypothetical protein